MKILFLFIWISSCAAILAFISNLLNGGDGTDVEFYRRNRSEYISVGKDLQNIFWFVQVSDIHVSRYSGHLRAPDLAMLCESELNVIKPDLVIASGDLTDAKFRDLRGSKQFLDEWERYYDVVQKCKETVATWLDMRGNHDAFDIPEHSHPSNLFRKYSSQGIQHSSSYIYHLRKPFGKYSFLAVDATPDPGPKRPFNFFGYIRQPEEELLREYIRESRTSNMTVAFGHYPTSLVATQSGNSVRQIIRNVTAYLCGHLHTLAGLVPNMYARHKNGVLELELGDWRDNRMYRLMAIDHDLFSFTDVSQGHWPVVMVTNPKHASMMSSNHEPLWRMRKSTHIRILVFTPGTVTNVEVYIDEIHAGKAKHVEGPLYVVPWRPERYSRGVHSIRVVVQDSLGNRRVLEQPFSLDGTSPLLPLSGRFILMMDISMINNVDPDPMASESGSTVFAKVGDVLFRGIRLQFVFLFIALVYLGVMLLLRRCQNVKIHFFTNTLFLFRPVIYLYNQWLYRMWLVTRISSIFYILVGFMIYVMFGPWFVGELLEGHIGMVFVWGMFVYGSYLPVCLTYVYGIFQIATFNVPLTLLLGYYLQYQQRESPRNPGLFHKARHIFIPFLVLVGFQVYIACTEFPAAYGTRAFVLGPVRTGSVILALLLFRLASKAELTFVTSPHHS